MKLTISAALALALSIPAFAAVAQEIKSMTGGGEVIVLELPKGDKDVLPQLNEILKDKDQYNLSVGGFPAAGATGGTSGGGLDLPTPFTNPLQRPALDGAPAAGLSDAEEGEIVQLCLTNADPARYGICKKYNVTASLLGSTGGN